MSPTSYPTPKSVHFTSQLLFVFSPSLFFLLTVPSRSQTVAVVAAFVPVSLLVTPLLPSLPHFAAGDHSKHSDSNLSYLISTLHHNVPPSKILGMLCADVYPAPASRTTSFSLTPPYSRLHWTRGPSATYHHILHFGACAGLLHLPKPPTLRFPASKTLLSFKPPLKRSFFFEVFNPSRKI